VYSENTNFPTEKSMNPGTNFLAGYSVGSVAITPINYIPAQNKLSYFEEITVTVTTTYNSEAEAAGRFLFESKNI